MAGLLGVFLKPFCKVTLPESHQTAHFDVGDASFKNGTSEPTHLDVEKSGGFFGGQ